MNHVYRIIYNRELGVMQVVSEIATGHGGDRAARGRNRRNRLLLAMLLSLASLGAGAAVVTPPQDNLPSSDATPQGGALPAPPAMPVNTLPTGGSISVGNGNIGISGSTMTVQQQSQYLAIDWQTFDIGSGASVNFLQPGSSSIALNRVLGSSTSNIFGKLTGNGQVWLLNPNGVLFGSSAQVNVGGLVASTLGLSDDDFIAGNYRFSGSGGSVVNQGNLSGGYVALLGESVRNEGTIAARMGTVSLAAGNKVTLDFNGDQLLNVQVDEGALHALVDNRGLIQADGGTVLMTARARDALMDTAVNNSGVIQARTVGHSQGRILLLGDADSGTVNVTGTLDASASGSDGMGGNGGFIETSAAHVNVADSAVITTKAASGQSGTWLIDPNDFTIAQSGGNITGAAVGTALDNNGNVIIATATSGTAGGSGDINVNDAVNWSSNNSLTLQAERSVNVNAAITATGNGAGLVVDYNQGSGITDGNFYVNATVNLPVTGSLAINGQAYTLITSLAGLSNPNGYYALVQDSSAAITATLGNLTGTLEGLGHSVSGININAASDQYVGLFNTLNQGSVVRNLSIDGSVTGNRFVGLLAAVNQGTVVNVHSSGSVNSSTGSAGGLVYGNGAQIGGGNYVAGVIDRSSSSATVTSAASNSVGGLVGSNSSLGIISNSYATGNVSSSQIVGGLAGTNAGTIVNSYATGNVSALPNGFAGGLVGSNNGDISFSYATGSVTGSARIGGLVGHNFGGSISNSYATGAVSGTSYVGGLVGINQGDLSNSYWDSYTTGQSDAVGYQPVGTATNISAVTSDPSQSSAANYAFKQSAYANFDFGSDWFMVEGSSRPMLRAFLNQADSNGLIAVTNLYQLQGMAANLSGHYLLTQDIDASATAASTVLADVWGGKGFAAIGTAAAKFTGSLDGQGHVIDGLTINRGAQDNVGLFGYADGASFTNVGLTDADITGRAFVGPLLGRGNNTAIDNTWSSGTVATTSTSTTLGGVGGLVGGADNSTIANSHSSALVHGFISVGGLIGQMGINDASSGASRISNSWTTGDVIADSGYGGGLVGRSYAYIANSHATGNVSGGKVTANGISALGGLVGFGAGSSSMSDPQYLNVYAAGNVTGTGNDVGGLVGLMEGEFVMHNAFATGNVQGNNAVGGLIGRLTNSGGVQSQAKLYTVYTQGGTVTGNNFVGGLIGQSFFVGINSSYVASGAVTGTGDQVGGVIGGIDCTCNAGAISTSEGVVWNYETTGQLNPMGKKLTAPYDNLVDPISWTAAEGPDYLLVGTKFIGANTAQMMTLDPYKTVGWFLGQYGLSYFIVTAATAAGRDYSDSVYLTNTWFLYEGNTYPLLRAFLTKVTVNADLSGANKIYDGSIASGTVGSYTTNIPVDASLILGSLNYATNSANAGTYTTSSGLDVSGGLYSSQLGYEIAYSPTTSLIINPAALTITANDASKTYDGLAWTGGNGVTYSGFVNGEDFNVLSGTLTWGGTGQNAVNAGSYSLIASGLSSGNYVITYQDGTLNIAKASAVITANSGTLTYNGLLQAITGYTVTGLVPGDAPGVITGVVESGGAGTNAGTYAHTVSGGSAANYTLSYVPGSLIINPAALTITANDASKTYDGLAWTGGNGVTYSGFVDGEDYNVLSGTLTWSGTSQGAVNAGVYSLIASGLSSGNYVITYQDGTLNIAKASAVITANSGTLTYNGLLQAITGYTVTGLVPGDAPGVITGVVESGGSGINAGTYAHTVSGGSATNYNLTYVPGSLIINPAALTITANDASKTYDGLTWTGGNGVTYSGFVNGEDYNVLSGTLTWSGTSQGAVNAGVYSLIASGLSSGNYVITYQDGTLNIAKANAVITANSGTLTYNGLLQAITGYSITGLVNGENASVITGLTESGGSGINAGTYAHTVSGGSATNYNLTYVTGSLLINPASITVTTGDVSKIYDGTTDADGSLLIVDGQLYGNDSLSGGNFAFTDKNAGTDKTVTVGGVTVNDGNNGGNYAITYVANHHSTILQKVLTIGGGFNAADKLYDGTTDAQILQSTLRLVGVVAGDSVGLDWAAAFADADIGLDKLVALLGGSLYGDDSLNYHLDWTGAPTARASIFGSGAAIFGPGFGAAQASVDAAAEQAAAHPVQGTADITVLQCGQNLPPELVKDCR